MGKKSLVNQVVELQDAVIALAVVLAKELKLEAIVEWLHKHIKEK